MGDNGRPHRLGTLDGRHGSGKHRPVSTRYVVPRSSRCIQQRVDGVEQLRTPTPRNWFVLLFLSFWLCMWTMGGLATVTQMMKRFDLFLLFWLGGWALGWAFAAAVVANQLGGSEVIRVVGRDLEISRGVGPLRRRKLYRGDLIRHLDSSDPNPMGWPWFMSWGAGNAPFRKPRVGAIKFDYGAETVYAASDVDEADGRTIVEWLKPKLPRSATIATDYSSSD